jgi:hypothetical protein
MKSLHSHCYGKPTLSCSRWPNTEGDGVFPNGIDIPFLTSSLWAHHASSRAFQNVIGQNAARTLFGTNHHNAAIHYRLIESLATLEEKNHLFEQTTNLVGSRTRATNLVASHHYCDIGECIFDSAQ